MSPAHGAREPQHCADRGNFGERIGAVRHLETASIFAFVVVASSIQALRYANFIDMNFPVMPVFAEIATERTFSRRHCAFPRRRGSRHLEIARRRLRSEAKVTSADGA